MTLSNKPLVPRGSWTPLATNAFVSGTFSFTNAIVPGEKQRFFLLQVP